MPKEYIPGVEKGIESAKDTGTIAGSLLLISRQSWLTEPATMLTHLYWRSRLR